MGGVKCFKVPGCAVLGLGFRFCGLLDRVFVAFKCTP